MKSATTLLLAAMALAVAQDSLAEEVQTLLGGTVGASVKLGTDYVFRGESETNDGQIPAIQGSITWSHPSGFYAGFFGSTNKFVTAPDISAVVGPYLGKSGNFGNSHFGYDVMVFDYEYPGANRYNYTELYMYLTGNFKPFSVKLEVTPTLRNWFGWRGHNGVNYAIHPKVALPAAFTLDGGYGYQKITGDDASGWHHWNVGVSKSYWGLLFDLRYHDTDLNSSHPIYGNYTYLFDSRVVLSVSKAL